MNLIEAKDLMVFYENAIALNNVSLQCKKGEITGLFGANSAGKTTLMFTLSGVILDTAQKEKMRGGIRIAVLGDIFFKGQSIMQEEASRRARLGLILCPERRRIFKESTVIENLRIGGIIASKAEAKKTLDYVFTIFPQLARLRNREGGFLSGGEQQMLAIGRALMAQPELLMLDEPLLGLSPVMEDVLINAVQDINREIGLTIFVAEQF